MDLTSIYFRYYLLFLTTKSHRSSVLASSFSSALTVLSSVAAT